MKDESAGQPGRTQPKAPESAAAGVYATGMATAHTREEFVLDFIAGYTHPARLAIRIIIHPGHALRLAKALRDNLALYEKNFGKLPEPPTPESAAPKQIPVQDMYSKLSIADEVLPGRYANNVLIRHTREEFVLDFLAAFHPAPVLSARVLVSPSHIQRIIRVLDARLRAYQESFGKLKDAPVPTEPSDPPEPPSRFSLS